MVRVQSISLLILSFFLSSCCPPTSIHPLSSPEKAQYDNRLEDTWIHKSENGDIGYLHIGKTEGNLIKAIATEIKKSGELDYTVFTMFPTIVNNNNFLNIKAEEVFENLPPEKAGYIFARYELTGNDNLSVDYMDGDQFAKAIQSGRLQGEITYRKSVVPESSGKERQVEERKRIDCVRITDTPENILNFIKNSSLDVLFPDGIKLKRPNFK